MGESKRREAKMTDYEKAMQALAQRLTDEGRLIEAGWCGLRAVWIPVNAPPDQFDAARKAFMAGALHLFSSLMTILDPGTEPTLADLRRMDLIDGELKRFGEEIAIGLPAQGNA